MRIRRTSWLPLAALCLAAAGGCARRAESAADHAVVAAARRYNEALPQAYARGSAALLGEAATPDEMVRVDDLISFLTQGKLVMDARQESFRPGSVHHLDAKRAELDAEEVWWYRHWNPATGEVKQPGRRVRYRNRYSLLLVGKTWLVDRLKELGYEQLK